MPKGAEFMTSTSLWSSEFGSPTDGEKVWIYHYRQGGAKVWEGRVTISLSGDEKSVTGLRDADAEPNHQWTLGDVLR